jgi:hypothetical protein
LNRRSSSSFEILLSEPFCSITTSLESRTLDLTDGDDDDH